MKKAKRVKSKSVTTEPEDHLRPEYRIDYTKSRPNRFAAKLTGRVVAVILEPDVAALRRKP
jgi:hypothetical protein